MFEATELDLNQFKNEEDQIEIIGDNLVEIHEDMQSASAKLDSMKTDLDPPEEATNSPKLNDRSPGIRQRSIEEKSLDIVSNDMKLEIMELTNQIKRYNQQKAEALKNQKR